MVGREKRKRKRQDSEERKIRNEIAQEVAAGIKASTHDDKPTAQRTVGQSVKQNCDCSQIENEKKEEEDDWRKENQMGRQWDEGGKLE